MNILRSGFLACAILLFVHSANAQVPFIFPGASAFTPEISIVNTGTLLDMQATVSADQKYVTLTTRAQASTLLALRSFNFQQGGTGLGNAGDPPPRTNDATANGNSGTTSAVNTSPSDILAHGRFEASVLHRQGMVRVSKLKE